jgi:hypothetical protein
VTTTVADTTVLLPVPHPSGQVEEVPERTVDGVVVKILMHLETRPGSRIDRVALVGFAEVTRAGVLDRGDRMWVGDRLAGTVRGFDACHFPDHYNVLIATAETPTGPESDPLPETPVRFEPATGRTGAGLDRPRRSE